MASNTDSTRLKLTMALALAGLILFGQSLNDPFHFDDVLIVNDSNVVNPAHWRYFFNPLHLRQLTFFTFYLNHLAGGDDPSGYHVVNVAIHIANAVLFFFLLSRFVERWLAIAAAAVFLAHPIQTESVLYVYQRSTLLACFFSLLALIALAARRLWWALLMFILAFESKESALAVPAVAALLRGVSEMSSRIRSRLRPAAARPIFSPYLRIALVTACVIFTAATLG